MKWSWRQLITVNNVKCKYFIDRYWPLRLAKQEACIYRSSDKLEHISQNAAAILKFSIVTSG